MSLGVIALYKLSRLCSVFAQIMNVNFCSSANTGVTMLKNPWNIAYEFNITSPAILSMLAHLRWFVKWELIGCTATVIWGAASRICSKYYAASIYASHPTSICFIIVQVVKIYSSTHLTNLGKISVFYLRDQISTWSITCSCFNFAYVDITFSRWDIVTKVYKLVYYHKSLTLLEKKRYFKYQHIEWIRWKIVLHCTFFFFSSNCIIFQLILITTAHTIILWLSLNRIIEK